mgnify:CR=1 FL=1
MKYPSILSALWKSDAIVESVIEKDYLFDLMTAAKVTRDYNAEAKPEDQAVFGICIQTFQAKSMFDDRKRDITMPFCYKTP